MIKSRFQRELSGELGSYQRERAEKELEGVRSDIANGFLTIDEKGVARNRIGRVVMDDILERIVIVSAKVNEEETRKARKAEVNSFIAEYRNNYKGPASEQLAEMQAEFGKGAKVADIFAGTDYIL